jgi:hypothetical protein
MVKCFNISVKTDGKVNDMANTVQCLETPPEIETKITDAKRKMRCCKYLSSKAVDFKLVSTIRNSLSLNNRKRNKTGLKYLK